MLVKYSALGAHRERTLLSIWMDGWMDGWMCGWMDGWVGEWMGGWMGGWDMYTSYMRFAMGGDVMRTLLWELIVAAEYTIV